MERHSEGCQGAKLTRPGYKRAAEINTAIVYGAAALWCSPVVTHGSSGSFPASFPCFLSFYAHLLCCLIRIFCLALKKKTKNKRF